MEFVRPGFAMRTVRWLIAIGVLLCVHSRATAQSSGGGSLMRQMATLDESLPELEPWQTLAMPHSISDRSAFPAAFQTAEPAGPGVPNESASNAKWRSPYSMSESSSMLSDDSEGWYDFLPDGCVPWGPRTSREDRHIGICCPLEGTSWLNRPCTAGWGIGGLFCDDPLAHRVDCETGVYGIYRLGWDYDYYWGLETRLGQATPAVHDRNLNTPDSTADVTTFDVSLLWYPTGDSRLRPYVCMGLGFQHLNFRDHHFDVVNTSTFSMPFGIGVKWMCTPWIALRLEATENLAVGNDQLDMMHNGALTAGMEVRFGGHRPSYWPWNPNRTIW